MKPQLVCFYTTIIYCYGFFYTNTIFKAETQSCVFFVFRRWKETVDVDFQTLGVGLQYPKFIYTYKWLRFAVFMLYVATYFFHIVMLITMNIFQCYWQQYTEHVTCLMSSFCMLCDVFCYVFLNCLYVSLSIPVLLMYFSLFNLNVLCCHWLLLCICTKIYFKTCK